MGQRLTLYLVCAFGTVGALPLSAEQRELTEPSRKVLTDFATQVGQPIDVVLGGPRPAPIDSAARARVVAALPSEGAVSVGQGERAKMQLAEAVLAREGRSGSITVTVINVAPAFVGLHQRAVILISMQALRLLSGAQFAALVAHELGLEYFWRDYSIGSQRGDHARMRELELRCDAVAVLVLRRSGFFG
jgi:hypothetical protein